MPTKVFIRAPTDDDNLILTSMSSSSNDIFFPNNLLFRRSLKHLTLSSKDISASSRLSGYLLIFTAYVVLLVSSLQHEQDGKTIQIQKDNYKYYEDDDENTIFLPISEWKRMSCMIASASFAGLMVFIVLIHFDTFFFPQLWLQIFGDGSIGEGIILTILFVAAIFTVFVSTSVNGIGGVVGKNYNAYFSSWMGFFACVYTFGLWKNNAMLNSVSQAL